jgi:hypothetical protein
MATVSAAELLGYEGEQGKVTAGAGVESSRVSVTVSAAGDCATFDTAFTRPTAS